MLFLIALGSLMTLLIAALRYAGARAVAGKKAACDEYQIRVYAAHEEHAGLKRQVEELQRSVASTAALFDLTRDVCTPLDQERIFSMFRGHIERFVRVDDCRLVLSKEEAGAAQGYELFPLKARNRIAGYLLLRGVNAEDRPTLDILTGQLQLGLQRAVLYRRVQELALTDGLTGAMNRRYFMERFDDELRRAKELKRPLSFLMIDLDHFKEVNDTYGHLVGDAVLRAVAGVIKENMRQPDFLGRYGGEELSVVLSETGKEQARHAAERIRQAVADRLVQAYDERVAATLSVGVASFPDDGALPGELIEKADHALYRAKNAGRNRVEVWE